LRCPGASTRTATCSARARVPYAPERKYTPCDASKAQLFALRDHLGFARNVVVQATCHGADNRAMVDACRPPGKARGVATVKRRQRRRAAALHAAGVRGVRFNFVKRLVDFTPKDELMEIAGRIAKLGWHVVIYFEAVDLPELWDFFTALPTTVVVDHMGRPDVSKPWTARVRAVPEVHARARQRVEQGELPRAPVGDRPQGAGRRARRLPRRGAVRAPRGREFPDRVLWGTDWPHPNLKDHMPDDGLLVDFIPHIAPTAELQRKLLVDNPMRLYWPEVTVSLNKPYLDVPGTTIFDAEQSRKGYWLNQFCMSLMKAENRERFKPTSDAYLDEWPMTEEQKQAVLARDLNWCMRTGGNIYFLAKIGATDGKSFQQMAGSMTGMTERVPRHDDGRRPLPRATAVGEDGDAQAHPAAWQDRSRQPQQEARCCKRTHHRIRVHLARAGHRRGHRPGKTRTLLGAPVQGLRASPRRG
jgi:2-pyrone-4,6-dicarboxylate lactonase